MFPKLSSAGDDAFKAGFLNKAFANSVIDVVNLIGTMEIKCPPNMGSAKAIWSGQNLILDFTKFGIGNGGTLNIWVVFNGGPTQCQFSASILPA